MMNGLEKSDPSIVAGKPTNKSEGAEVRAGRARAAWIAGISECGSELAGAGTVGARYFIAASAAKRGTSR